MTPPWWTEADAAEFDVLVWELVRLHGRHRDHPDVAAAVGEAVDAILDWRRARDLRSRAAYLRTMQDAIAA